MEHESIWQKDDITAADIIFDIMRMKEAVKMQSFFSMNQNTKFRVFRGSAEYDNMIVVDERIPDDLIVSFGPSSHEHIKLIQVSKKPSSYSSEIQPYRGNRKQRREAERANRRRMKRK